MASTEKNKAKLTPLVSHLPTGWPHLQMHHFLPPAILSADH
jgi:hypothetical protein